MRNKFLVAALIVVGLASVAYAAYAQILTISGTGTATGEWNVAITGITRTSATGATDAAAPAFTGTSATFNTNLAYPGATATYQVVIQNTGTIPASLSTITGLTEANAAAPTYITYALSGVAPNDVLAPAGTVTATVTVTWDAASSPSTPNETKTANIALNYVQGS